MSNQYRLVGLGNSELLAGLSELVRRGNELTAQVLAHLVEVEQRMLHLELGFSSLFSYCLEALEMSEGSAGRRVTAARLCRQFPDIFERVAGGALHLCSLCALAPHLTAENAPELLEACRGKTRRQVEELLAIRFPRPDVREQIRRLPPRVQVPVEVVQALPAVTRTMQTALPTQVGKESLPPAATLDGGRVSAQTTPAPTPAVAHGSHRRTPEIQPLSADRFGVHFTADAELRDLIERARALARHRLPNGNLAELVKLMATSFVRQEEKRRFGIGAVSRRMKTDKTDKTDKTEPNRARRTGSRTPPGGASGLPRESKAATQEAAGVPRRKCRRYVSARVRREIHARDEGQCAFVSAAGRRCEAKALLEFDHRQPFARFGAADVQNLRLLCKAHNLLHARNCFGEVNMAAKIGARKRLGLTHGEREESTRSG